MAEEGCPSSIFFSLCTKKRHFRDYFGHFNFMLFCPSSTSSPLSKRRESYQIMRLFLSFPFFRRYKKNTIILLGTKLFYPLFLWQVVLLVILLEIRTSHTSFKQSLLDYLSRVHLKNENRLKLWIL